MCHDMGLQTNDAKLSPNNYLTRYKRETDDVKSGS